MKALRLPRIDWTQVATRYLPFADAATIELPLPRLARRPLPVQLLLPVPKRAKPVKLHLPPLATRAKLPLRPQRPAPRLRPPTARRSRSKAVS